MTGMSCAFILAKSSDLSLRYYYFFFICTTMLLDNGYREASDYIGGFDLGDA
jgi:hypothetical protein